MATKHPPRNGTESIRTNIPDDADAMTDAARAVMWAATADVLRVQLITPNAVDGGRWVELTVTNSDASDPNKVVLDGITNDGDAIELVVNCTAAKPVTPSYRNPAESTYGNIKSIEFVTPDW